MRCLECQHENPSDAKFCNQCATPLVPVCSACHHENPTDAKFCNQCSTPLINNPFVARAADAGPQEAESERRLQVGLRVAMAILHREQRVTYRTLKYLFGFDNALLAEISEELRLRRLAVDEERQVLVWSGDVQPPREVAPLMAPLTNPDLSPIATESHTGANSTVVLETSPTAAWPDESVVGPEPVRSVPEAERRQLTVMFCDLVGSTELSGRLDPEDFREVVRAYQKEAAEVIERYEGHIAQYLGDGLLIYFGYPIAHEDDAQRAAHTGLGIIEAMGELNTRLEADYAIELAVRIGIHTGPVVVGEMGGGGRLENLALGETPNIAARIESLATANTVMVSPATARLVQGAFALEVLGQYNLKGVSKPMRIAQVIGPLEPGATGPAIQGFEVLMGRDEEIGLLLRRWEQSKEGMSRVILLSGEAGIGKSSLVEGLRRHVHQGGHASLTFRCSPYHTNSTLYPIIDAVPRKLGWQPDDTADVKVTKLEQALEGIRSGRDEAISLMASLLSLELPGERYSPLTLDSQQQRQQTQDMLVSWLQETAENESILLVWEDLHWADPSTVELLELFVDQAPTAAILHVITFRPEFEPPWPTRSHLTPMTLNRLERLEVEALITQMANGRTLPVEVVEHIVAKTDGVPLYVEELTKMLLTSDLLQVDIDRYVLTGSLSMIAIPNTLQDSLMARLDQLTTAKEVAQLGAVLGREFDYELIQAVSSQDEERLRTNLGQLVEAELLYQRGRPPRSRYTFKHALIQDAAYASLLRMARQQVHHQVAQLLEKRFADVVATQPELLAYHYTEAGLSEPAVAYWQRAGEHAQAQAAFVEATAHLRKGLELLTALPETRQRMQVELDLQTPLALAYHSIHSQAAPELEQCYLRICELGEHLGDAHRLFYAHLGLLRYYGGRGQRQQSLASLDTLFRVAHRAQDPRLLVQAHMIQGTLMLQDGHLTLAREHLEQAMVRYHPQDHPLYVAQSIVDPGVNSLSRSSWTLWFLGYPEQALARSQETLALAEELNHVHSSGLAYGFAAMLLLCCRDREAVRAQAEDTMILATQHGVGQWQLVAAILQAWYAVHCDHQANYLIEFQQAVIAYRNQVGLIRTELRIRSQF